jgi:cell division cycle 14
VFLPVIRDFVFLCDSATVCTLDTAALDCLEAGTEMEYCPFADDFGPLNMAKLSQFMNILRHAIRSRKGRKVVYSVPSSARSLANAVFLMGAYLIVELGFNSNDAWTCFSIVEPKIEMYRDAQETPTNFKIEVIDCWRGLERANNLNWIESTDMEEYAHYSNLLEGDLNAIIPDKLIAFRGPVQLPAAKEYVDVGGVRFFASSFYVPPFLDMGVSTVIQLNSRQYDTAPLETAGIRCIRIELDEGAIPSSSDVLAFFDAVAAADGAVAVHCKKGLGRTGTMVAVHLMTAYGFAAREAIGWIRIVRPGSIIGAQQHFLCRLGGALERHAAGCGDKVGRSSLAEALQFLEQHAGHASSISTDDDDRSDSAAVPAFLIGRSASFVWPISARAAPEQGDAEQTGVAPFLRSASAGSLVRGRRDRVRPQSEF